MDMYDRQIRVFGKAGQKALAKLTVGIIGLGGIGSLIFILLVRLGVGRIVIIDPDIVEKSNLNRLAGSKLEDVKKKTSKVNMLKKYAALINPGIKIIAIQKSIHEKGLLNHLKACDVIFGCTDNQSSRWVLNKFSVEHLIPYFDTGTGIRANAKQNIEHAGGQVRVVIPGMGCLNCIDGINVDIAQQEMLPEPDRRIAIQRGYIAGSDVPAPAVASLNGAIANLAVTEFIAFITGFKPLRRYVFYDFLNTRVVGFKFEKDSNCFTCSPVGSLAIGDKGKPMPVDMLIDEPKPQKQVKGGPKMETQNTNIKQSIANLLTTAQQQGFEVEGNADAQWFLIKNAKLSRQFNKPKTSIMVKFIDDSKDPIILAPDNLEIEPDSGVCTSFLGKSPYIKGWKSLCPHMFQDIGDEMLEFVACLTGFIANPLLCGLMGCEGKDRIKKEK